jgi:hypothetical protein
LIQVGRGIFNSMPVSLTTTALLAGGCGAWYAAQPAALPDQHRH